MRLIVLGRVALFALLPLLIAPSRSVAEVDHSIAQRTSETFSIKTPMMASGVTPSFELDLQLVIFERSGWTRPQVVAHLDRTSQILAPCGIRLANLTLTTLNVADEDLNVEFFFGQDLNVLARSELSTLARPMILFVSKLVDENGWDMEPQFTWQVRPDIEAARQNTIWIGSYVESAEYRRYLKDPKYDPVAHEIGHALGIPRDLASPAIKSNLMGDGRDTVRDDSLTAAQCAQLRTSPLLRPIARSKM